MQETPPNAPVPPQGAPEQQAPPLAQPPAAAPVGQAPAQGDYLHPIANGPAPRAYHPKRTIIILSVIVLVCLVAVALLVAYAAMPRQAASDTTHQTTTQEPAQTKLTAKETLDSAKKYLTGAENAQQPIALPVIAPGKTFYTVIPEAAPVSGLVQAVAGAKIQDTLTPVEKTLLDSHYKQRTVRELDDTAGYLAYFTRDDVVCQTTVAPTKDKAPTRALELDCTDIAHYTEYAEVQQPFATIYTPAASSSTYIAFTGKPIVKPGGTAGYSLTEIPVSTVIDQGLTSFGTVAMYYQTPDKLWHYLVDRDPSVLVNCSKFTDRNARFAYAGTTCDITNTSKTSIVKAPTS